MILFSCEFCEISKNTFFTEHLRAIASVKIEMQIKNYDFKVNKFTHYFHGLSGMSYKTPHLKQHHCNNSWESKILQQMSSEYLLSTSAYQNWLLICGTGNKWHICKRVYMELSESVMNYFEMLDWFPFPPPPPPPKKKFL